MTLLSSSPSPEDALTSVLPIALYTRLSDDQNGRKINCETQEENLRERLPLIHPGRGVLVFNDPSVSAYLDDADRPGFDALVAAIRAGKVGGVMSSEQTRLARGDSWAVLRKACLGAGIDTIFTLKEGLVQIGLGQMAGNFNNLVAQNEVETIIVRTTDAFNKRKKLLLPPNCRWRFGYDWVPDTKTHFRTIAPNEHGERWVPWMAERVLAGDTTVSIAERLTEAEVPTENGGPWTRQTVKQILTNPVYAGYVTAGPKEARRILGKGEWPALLDDDTFVAVNAILTAPRKVTRLDGTVVSVGARRPARRYELTGGFCFCGLCGTELIAQWVKARDLSVYKCVTTNGGCNRIDIVAEGYYADGAPRGLESEIERRVLRIAGRPNFRRRYAKATSGDGAEERRRITTARLAAQARKLEVAEAYGKGAIDLDMASAARAAADRELGELQAREAALPPVTASVDLDEVVEAWETTPLAQRRAFYSAIDLRVVVQPASRGNRFDAGRVEATALGLALPV